MYIVPPLWPHMLWLYWGRNDSELVLKTHIRLGIRSGSPSDQNPRCPHEETLGPYLTFAKCRGENPRRNKWFLFFSAKNIISRKRFSAAKREKRAFFLGWSVYSPGARAENHLGTNFWCQQKALITSTVCCKFQRNLFEFTFFNVFPHVYSPGAGADSLLRTKFWCQQKGVVTLPICCKFQNNSFEVWFYIYNCLFLYLYIALGQGQTTPRGQNFYFNINLLSLCSFAVSFFH